MWPSAASGRTWYQAARSALALVSKPDRGTVATTFSEALVAPASTCQRTTSVAPFQLMNALAPPAVLRTVSAGGSMGCPVHGILKAR